MNIQRLTLETNNLETMKDFYSRILELPTRLENGILYIQIGSSELVFLENPQTKARYHFAFNIPEQQIDQGIQWLEARVPLILENGTKKVDFPNWNAYAVYFADPAGNILELIARRELTHSEIIPFDSSGLLNISEIGISVPDATVFANWTEEILGITRYRTGSSSFTSIGDANGLIIAVSIGREWHPNTGILAEPFYTKIEFVGEESPISGVQYLDLPYFFSRV